MKELTHKQMSSYGGTSSWKKRTEGKTPDEIKAMMSKMKKGKKHNKNKDSLTIPN